MAGRDGKVGRGWRGGRKTWKGAGRVNLVRHYGARDYRVGSFSENEPKRQEPIRSLVSGME